jgi:hypothetical protein
MNMKLGSRDNYSLLEVEYFDLKSGEIGDVQE